MASSANGGRRNNSSKPKQQQTNNPPRRKGSGSLSQRYTNHPGNSNSGSASQPNSNNVNVNPSNNNNNASSGIVGVATTATANHESQIQKQCFRTKLCSFFKEGKCNKGERCSFAHARDELHMKPDFSKTRLCVAFGQNKCNKAFNECNFAHGEQDLKKKIIKSSLNHISGGMQCSDDVPSSRHLSSAVSNVTTTSTLHNTNSGVTSGSANNLDNEDSLDPMNNHKHHPSVYKNQQKHSRRQQQQEQHQYNNKNSNKSRNHLNIDSSHLNGGNDVHYGGPGGQVSLSVLPNGDEDINGALLYSDSERINAIASRERGISMCSVNSLVNSRPGYMGSPHFPIGQEPPSNPQEYFHNQAVKNPHAVNNDSLMFRNFASLQPANFGGGPNEHQERLGTRSQDYFAIPENSGSDAPHVYIPGTTFAPSNGNPNDSILQQRSRELIKAAFQSGDSRHSVRDEHSDLPPVLAGTSIMSDMYFNNDLSASTLHCGFPTANDFVNLTTSPTFTTDGVPSGLPAPPSFVVGQDPVTAAMYGQAHHHSQYNAFKGSSGVRSNGGLIPGGGSSGIKPSVNGNNNGSRFDTNSNRPRTHSAIGVPIGAVSLGGVGDPNTSIPPLLSHKLPPMFSSELGSDEGIKGLYFKDGTNNNVHHSNSGGGGGGHGNSKSNGPSNNSSVNNSGPISGSNAAGNDNSAANAKGSGQGYFNPRLVNYGGHQHQHHHRQ